MTDFYRNVHCVMGLPIDAMAMGEALERLQQARVLRTQCFFSTPNLNFTIGAQSQPLFRESVCRSDLSLADGMPLVWVARLLGIPVAERVCGSDLFDRLRQQTSSLWRVFFFGGPKGVGQTACLAIGDQRTGVLPTGYIYPGYADTTTMSRNEILECINQSQSDMVVVSLGAAKGQDWICRNRGLINAPVIGHLGAVINFVAGNVKRAPRWMQRAGLEWVWRAKEESTLVRRYLKDGVGFLRLLATQVVPLALHQRVFRPHGRDFKVASVALQQQDSGPCWVLTGAWSQHNLAPVRDAFTQAEQANGDVALDMAAVPSIDSAFVALLLLLDQSQRDRGLQLRLLNTPWQIRLTLQLSGVQHLCMP